MRVRRVAAGVDAGAGRAIRSGRPESDHGMRMTKETKTPSRAEAATVDPNPARSSRSDQRADEASQIAMSGRRESHARVENRARREGRAMFEMRGDRAIAET